MSKPKKRLTTRQLIKILGADPKRTKKVRNIAEALDHWRRRHDDQKNKK